MMNVSGKARAGRNGLCFPETHQDRCLFFFNPKPINKSSSVVEAKEGISEESKNPKLWVCVPFAGENLNLSSKLK